MRKILLTIALVSSLAFSTVASAAVNYEGATDISTALSYDGGILDVGTDVYNANSTKDVTLVVVAGENPTDIVQGDIMYIDQIDMPATAGASTFQDLGLLIPEGTKKATVIINNGGVALLTGTVTIESEPQIPSTAKTFVFGDVNGTYVDGTDAYSYIEETDAVAIMKRKTGGGYAKGGAFDMGTVLVDVATGKKFVFGDVNGTYVDGTDAYSYIEETDAVAIMKRKTGGGYAKNGAFDMGTVITAYPYVAQ